MDLKAHGQSATKNNGREAIPLPLLITLPTSYTTPIGRIGVSVGIIAPPRDGRQNASGAPNLQSLPSVNRVGPGPTARTLRRRGVTGKAMTRDVAIPRRLPGDFGVEASSDQGGLVFRQ